MDHMAEINASERIEATTAMVIEMRQAHQQKELRHAAYLRVAATYAMVEVRRTVRRLVQHESAMQDAQTRLPDIFTISDLEKAFNKNQRVDTAYNPQQKVWCAPQQNLIEQLRR